MDGLVTSYRKRIFSALGSEPKASESENKQIELYHQRVIFDKLQGERSNLWALADQDIAKFDLILSQSVEQVTELIMFKIKESKKQSNG